MHQMFFAQPHPFFRGPHVFFGPRVYLGAPYFVNPNPCGWLYERARETGSPYWWHRYNMCIGGY
jgi:hypothetical protein